MGAPVLCCCMTGVLVVFGRGLAPAGWSGSGGAFVGLAGGVAGEDAPEFGEVGGEGGVEDGLGRGFAGGGAGWRVPGGGDGGVEAGLGRVLADGGPGGPVPAGRGLADGEFRVGQGEQRDAGAEVRAHGSQLTGDGGAVHGPVREGRARRDMTARVSDGGNPAEAETSGSGSGTGWPSPGCCLSCDWRMNRGSGRYA